MHSREEFTDLSILLCRGRDIRARLEKEHQVQFFDFFRKRLRYGRKPDPVLDETNGSSDHLSGGVTPSLLGVKSRQRSTNCCIRYSVRSLSIKLFISSRTNGTEGKTPRPRRAVRRTCMCIWSNQVRDRDTEVSGNQSAAPELGLDPLVKTGDHSTVPAGCCRHSPRFVHSTKYDP